MRGRSALAEYIVKWRANLRVRPPLGSLEPLTLRTAIQGAKGDGCFGITRSRRTGPGWCVASQIGGLASGRADLHIINLDASFANGWGDDQGELFIGTIAIKGPL